MSDREKTMGALQRLFKRIEYAEQRAQRAEAERDNALSVLCPPHRYMVEADGSDGDVKNVSRKCPFCDAAQQHYRAHKAEAECERLRDFPDVMRAGVSHLRKGTHSSLSNEDAIRIAATEHWADELEHRLRTSVSATSPPESEPCKRCNGRGTTHKDDGICGQFPCKRCDGNGNDPVRKALAQPHSDGGVPYIPEEVRRFPDLMRRLVREQKMSNETRDYIDALSHRLDAALAPPEGEPTNSVNPTRPDGGRFNAPHTPEQADRKRPHITISDDVMEVAQQEQAHGDALAAFARLCNWYDVPGDNDDIRVPGAAEKDVETVRQALTASGVPYIPEEVRRLPSDFRRRLSGAVTGQSEWIRGRQHGNDECAEELEAALDSAPADGWWKKGDHVEFVTDEITDKGPCTGKIRWVLDGLACIELADDFVHVRWSEIGNFRMARHHRTGWPLWIVGESAAAPQRGGEYE